MNVSVIIPSYNRANLLPITLPTYLQEDVVEVIVVDDCSTDNTQEVILELQKKYPQIRYTRNFRNLRQTYSKNVGIQLAKSEYIYFGDDDSILYPGSIRFLKETLVRFQAQICGAKALYLPLKYNNRIDDYVRLMNVNCSTIKKIVDVRKISANFTYSTSVPIEFPFCQAATLVEKKVAQQVMFDINYKGNAYREETDFFIRCTLSGAKIMFDSRAIQINLPRHIATGGAHGRGQLKWYYDTICNNWYFLKKNGKLIQAYYGFRENIYIRQFIFTISMISTGFWGLMKKNICK